MIDFNKTSHQPKKQFSYKPTIRSNRHNKVVKLTPENKRFLQLIGLLK